MAEQPVSGATPLYDKIEGVVNSLVFDVVLGQVLDYLTTAVPYLNWPVIKQIFSFIVRKILEVAYAKTELFVAFKAIENRVGSENAEFKDAASKLKVELDKPEGEKDAAKVEAAKKLAKDKLRELIAIQRAG